MPIINVNSLFELPPRHHGAGRFDAGFELGCRDVPVGAAELVGVADAVTAFLVDSAVSRWVATVGMFWVGLAACDCEGRGCEEEQEERERVEDSVEGWHGCRVLLVGGRGRWRLTGLEGFFYVAVRRTTKIDVLLGCVGISCISIARDADL